MDASTAERFEAFSLQHDLLIAGCLAGVLLAVWWGRRHRESEREQARRRTAAVTLTAVMLPFQVYLLTPASFSLSSSLPIALCDVALVAAVIALWTRDERAAGVTYYVGLTLTLQGVLTPALASPFPQPRWFAFWVLHLGVVWVAAYLVGGLGLRPTWHWYRFAVAALAAWALTVFLLNLALGTNYGFLNRLPSTPSLLDLFGPWPTYIVVAGVLILSSWALLLTWPWEYAERRRTRQRAGTG